LTFAFCLVASLAQAADGAPHAPAVPHAPAAPVHAAPPAVPLQATAIAKAWAQNRNLPVREIEVGPPERRVTRLFVPVKAEDWPSFVETFGNQPRSLMLKLKGGDSHLMPVTGGVDHLWGRSIKAQGLQGSYGMETLANDGPNGPAMVVELNDAESAHMKQWFAHRADPNDALYGQACGAACMDFIGNIEVAPAADGSNTLRAIPVAEINAAAQRGAGKGGGSASVPAGKKLFDLLGIARSKDGRNMTYNLIHAASERVQVIGVPMGGANGAGVMQQQVVVENGRRVVKNVQVGGDPVARFLAMSDADLLGPLPPQGVAGVVRPVK
jgi:hypothetical protein